MATAATTNSIGPGQLVPGSISAPAQTNFYSFTGASNDVIYLTILRTNGLGDYPYFYLHDPGGVTVANGYDTADYANINNLRLTRNGVYTLSVVDDTLSESFDYMVTYNLAKCVTNQREPGDGPETISPGQSSYGHIGPADYDTFCFSAASNDVIYLTILRTNGPGNYPYFYLHDPDGVTIANGYDTADYANINNLRLTRNGVYTLSVVDDTLSESFDYMVTYNLAKCSANQREPGDGPETISPGQSSYGHIGPADYDTFCFTAASNDVIYLTILRTNGLGNYPYFYLHDPDGVTVANGYDTADYANINNLRLTRTGLYTLSVVDDTLSESFDYIVTYNLAKCVTNQREAGDGPETISPGQSSYGHIGPADYDTFCFSAASNDVIYLTILRTNGPGNYPYLYLHDPDGVTIANGYDAADYANINNLRLNRNGVYTLSVVDDSLSESFDYMVIYNLAKCSANQREPDDGPEFINAGQSSYGHIGPADYDTFCFTAESNDVMYLTILRTNGLGDYPYFYLHDPGGVTIANGYDAADYANINNLRLTRTGLYTLSVVDDTLSESFDYMVTYNLAKCATNQREAGDGPETISPGQPSYGRIGPADYDTFCFSAASNDVIYLTILRTNGPGNYPYFYLHDPDGVTIANGYGTADYAATTLRLTRNGVYTLSVVDDSLSESFDYIVTYNLAKCSANQREPDDGPEFINAGQSSYGHIGPADFDTFCFTAASNDVIYLTILRTNGLGNYPYFYLHDPDGATIANGYSTADYANINNLRLTRTGLYTLSVVDDTLSEFFDYTLSMIKVPGPNLPDAGEGPELIHSGETRAGQITPGDLDAYTFAAIVGDSVWITLSQTFGAGGAYMYVYGPDGNVVDTATSQTYARIRIPCITKSGIYTIACLDASLSQAIGYNLTLIQNPGPPPSYDPDHPHVAIFRCMTNTVVRWPINAAGFQLQFCTDLCATNTGGNCYASWTNVPPPYSVIDDHYFVTNRSLAPMRFYRLRLGN